MRTLTHAGELAALRQQAAADATDAADAADAAVAA